MMTLKTTSAYITTVGADHTIVLPPEMPTGATVAVIVVPTSAPEPDDAARRARFEATLSAIRAASSLESPQVTISDKELDALVEQARKAPKP